MTVPQSTTIHGKLSQHCRGVRHGVSDCDSDILPTPTLTTPRRPTIRRRAAKCENRRCILPCLTSNNNRRRIIAPAALRPRPTIEQRGTSRHCRATVCAPENHAKSRTSWSTSSMGRWTPGALRDATLLSQLSKRIPLDRRLCQRLHVRQGCPSS
jgi:hypothetical protein